MLEDYIAEYFTTPMRTIIFVQKIDLRMDRVQNDLFVLYV